jgi:hypothetical protein
LTGV